MLSPPHSLPYRRSKNQKNADNNKTENHPLKLPHPKRSGFCFTVARTQKFLLLVFIIPWELSHAARQGQDAVPWFSRVGVAGHSQHLGVSLCDTLGVGHVRHMTQVCVVTSPSFLGARLPWWRGWHRAPVPGTAPVLCSGTRRSHGCCVTRVAGRLLRESCLRRVGLEGFRQFLPEMIPSGAGGVPSPGQTFQK